MKNKMQYKNFIGSVNYDDREELLYGRIEGIDDLITFEGKDTKELKKAFQDAVEDYLELCKEAGKAPGKSYKGSLNVRLTEDLHLQAAKKASERSISLNQLIREAVEDYISE